MGHQGNWILDRRGVGRFQVLKIEWTGENMHEACITVDRLWQE
ncbi:hypothetical protein ACFOPQ_05520 [Deinococcus antarcticus]|uniref:Uncharacterized protein n=1 Tax=Deinococcus antarcticus TaxID=1298767 RepID=A0ABV8A3G6_9DEIO